MQFGARLRSLRRAAGLSQEELAERAGLTANGVSALERGVRTRPYPHTVRSLAEALDLSEEDRDALVAAAAAGRDVDASRSPGSGTAEPSEEPAPVPGAGAVPVPPTELVGREAEVDAVANLLGRPGVRLVTLTGTGGVGKTRLATEVARHRDAAFVALAPLSDPTLVPSVIAATLGLPDAAGTSSTTLVEAMRSWSGLLVLDNFEHVAAASPTVVDLVSGCPSLTVLVSSRAPLRVRGENEVPVLPLPLPASTRQPDPAEVAASASGRLFLERARAVRPDFGITTDNAGDVAAICWRVGGLPLALELAAAKVKLLAPRDLLQRLDTALSVGWARDLPERQRTMRATLDWSYRLLRPDEQTLFRHVSVFAGPFGLEAAEAVAGPLVGELQVLELLEGLVEQSLVTVTHDPGGGTRYHLLEPVRQYGADLLQRGGEAEPAGKAFSAYYLAFAEEAATKFSGPEQVEWLRRTEAETSNLRAAILGALARGDGETAARMSWELWLAWWISGRFREGHRWVTEAMEHSLSPWARTRASLVRAVMNYAQSYFTDALEWWTTAAELARDSGDLEGEAGGRAGIGLATMSLGDFARAQESLRAALAISEEIGYAWMASLTSIWLGTLLLVTGDAEGSVPVFERATAGARERGDRLVVYVGLFNLASAALALGDDVRAESLFRESVALSQETRDAANLAFALDGLAVVEGRRGDARRSALLLGAAQAMREAVEGRVYHYYLPDDALRERTRDAARAALGAEAFEEAWRAGLALDLAGAASAAGSQGARPGHEDTATA